MQFNCSTALLSSDHSITQVFVTTEPVFFLTFFSFFFLFLPSSHPFEQIVLDYDYTFTTPYCGSETIEINGEVHASLNLCVGLAMFSVVRFLYI